MIYGDIFTGGGGASLGAREAGFELAFGIELDPTIAEVANANLGDHVMTADVLEVDPRRLEPVDVLHASPPCPSFSVAKTGRKETALDIAMAEKVAEFIRVLQPQIFTLENVEGYKRAKAWKLIENTLYACGYWVNVSVVNSADMGIPQIRRRLIVRAVKGGFVPQLPPKEPWIGWYQAIEDLIPTLPESQFADWQLERLEALESTVIVSNGAHGDGIAYAEAKKPIFTVTTQTLGRVRAFIVANGKYGDKLVTAQEDEPIFTITSQSGGRTRAWLVDGDGNRSRAPTILEDGRPSMTVQAWHGRRPAHTPKAWLEHGRVVAMTPRALARFQSFPDSYELPENKKGLACKIIGNACPPMEFKKIFKSLATPRRAARDEQLEAKGPS